MSIAAADRHRSADQETKARGPFTDDQAAQADPVPDAPHLVHIFPSFGLGGVPIRISTVINKLGGRYRHTIIALDGCLDSRTRFDPTVDATFKSFQTARYGLPATLWQARRFLRSLQPNLLLTYNWGAVEWAMANAINPVCRHIHFESGFGVEEADQQLRRRALFRRLALARAEYLVMPSLTLVDIATNIWRIPEAKQLYVPNGVDCQKYASSPKPGALPGFERKPGELVIGTVAPLRAEKNVARLVRAFVEISNDLPVRLMIAGDGPERLPLENLVRQHGIEERVFFTGMIENVERALGCFDVFALSSDTEQMPNSVLQAMAAGLPVVATDVGDVAQILSPANRRFAVSKNKLPAFSEALTEMLSNKALRDQLGNANRNHVRAHYDLGEMVRAYDELFQTCIS